MAAFATAIPAQPTRANIAIQPSGAFLSTKARSSFASFEGLKATNGTIFGAKAAVAFEAAEDNRMRMANLRAIRDRMGTVKNTQKITEAMRLVAAAKVRKAQDAVLQGRPFADKIVQVRQKSSVLYGLQNRLKIDTNDIPLLQQRPVKKIGILVIGGDRGLCGGYNAFLMKAVAMRCKELDEQGIAYTLITVGRKADQFFSRREYPIDRKFDANAAPTPMQSLMIADECLSLFLSGEVDKVELIYTRFISLISSKPVTQTLLPLDISGLESATDEIFRLTTAQGKLVVDVRDEPVPKGPEVPSTALFDQDPITLLNALLPLYLNAQIYRALQEAVASELSARMTAMQAATDNAKAVVKNLGLVYNRARQAAITQEILEVVGGAEALN
eukprot:tig00020610_g12068.t1